MTSAPTSSGPTHSAAPTSPAPAPNPPPAPSPTRASSTPKEVLEEGARRDREKEWEKDREAEEESAYRRREYDESQLSAWNRAQREKQEDESEVWAHESADQRFQKELDRKYWEQRPKERLKELRLQERGAEVDRLLDKAIEGIDQIQKQLERLFPPNASNSSDVGAGPVEQVIAVINDVFGADLPLKPDEELAPLKEN